MVYGNDWKVPYAQTRQNRKHDHCDDLDCTSDVHDCCRLPLRDSFSGAFLPLDVYSTTMVYRISIALDVNSMQFDRYCRQPNRNTSTSTGRGSEKKQGVAVSC